MTDSKLKKITVALAGNPNSGKTSVFNMLTGASHHVANYPGTTVETVQGTCTHGDFRIIFVDLPGAYGLTTFSAEELVARNFIIDEKPDIVVNVIDTSNLERNLYLTTQLIELGVPIVDLAYGFLPLQRSIGVGRCRAQGDLCRQGFEDLRVA